MESVLIILIVLAAVAAVIYPLVHRSATEPLEPETPAVDEAELEREIERYRVALRAGTLCRRCGAANPDGSRYCAECGRRLASAAA
jgi:ribosomal protein L40E